MEALYSELSFLSAQSLYDGSFDPSNTEDLAKLFEVDAYKAWANLQPEPEIEAQKARDDTEEPEEHPESAMDRAMAEFHRFEEEMDLAAKAELDSLIRVADNARKLGKSLERAATFASKKYIEAAVNSAAASVKSAVRAISSGSSKVHAS